MKIKNDKYKSARGGHSRILNIICRKCETHILTYQKDGPGNLRRMYLDRISEPHELTNLQRNPLKEIRLLNCKSCKEILGTPCIYKKENRKAFRVYVDAVKKKVTKQKSTPQSHKH